MPYIDIFNGDADGICALHQLRLNNPRNSKLITGVKRDTLLLDRVISMKDCVLTVLDISTHANRNSLIKLLEQGNTIHYFDHHFAGDIPESPLLHSHIDTSHDVCTSILVDRYLEGEYRSWAIVAAFGDNLHSSANKLADSLKLDSKKTDILREMGELINYNAYGETIEDLYFSPESIYLAIQPFSDPFDFYQASGELVQLREGFRNDMSRVCGVYSNQIAREAPAMAHALLVERKDGTYQVSVRAPFSRPFGAENLCYKFSGGGRAVAAGINSLAVEEVERFFQEFDNQFSN